ncbi:MAG TPA: MarR family transcriptional regulator [Acidimicrobiia bacterium]|nr:MarR family transcriptional regulator [Acidimicrobiia bacterium]
MDDDPHETGIPVEAARAAAQLGRTVSVALARSELTPAGYRLLAYLATGDTASKVLAAKLAVSRPVVTATLDWLEPRGYVTRRQDGSDRRRVEIAITDEGRRALQEADRLVIERLTDVTANLEPARVAELVAALQELGVALNEFRARGIDPDSGRFVERDVAP